MAVDNYFALYINGAVVHPADPNNDLWTALAFEVPIRPSTNNSTGDGKVVFSVRGVNARDTPHINQNPAGIVAAIKISFDGNKESETFITGANMKWRGEALLEPGWVEVDFDDSKWNDAVVFSPQLANAIWAPHRRRSPTMMLVGTSLPHPSTISSVPVASSVPVHIGGPTWGDWTITLGPRELAGILIGLAFVTVVLAGMAAFLRARLKSIRRASYKNLQSNIISTK
ncbi:hypothetical protein EST38_g5384 [Candolleomyces aberdarensis]|uniref:Uncharacterized protein n=1 Tax=Candolleomyces aberdarensis TaxID=2316362 RepID=A0A4Q2DKN9_9AGAR|nr:hypothetical protein EST38_g5384 [Candolleomyces aberdarensis]